MSWPGSNNTKVGYIDQFQQCCHVSALQQCNHVSVVQQCNHVSEVQQCSHVSDVQQCSHVSVMQQCSHVSAMQPCLSIFRRRPSKMIQYRMVQGYKRRWSGRQPSSRPTPIDGSIELLVLQYCPILSCLVLYFPAWLQPGFLALPRPSPVHNSFSGASVVTGVFIKIGVIVCYIQCYFVLQWGYF